MFASTLHPQSRTAIASTSCWRPTLSYLFANNKTFKPQTVAPELSIPADLDFKSTKHLVAPPTRVVLQPNSQVQRRSKKRPRARASGRLKKINSDKCEATQVLPSFESARRVPSDMPVVPFQLTSDATDEGIPDANVSVAIDLYIT